MATFTGKQVTNAPAQHNLHGVLHAAVGEINVAANPADGDIYTLVTLPAGALVVNAEFWVADIDTNASETLDIDFGWASNGGGSETFVSSDGTTYTNGFGTADPDGFVNSGVLIGDAFTTAQPNTAAGTYLKSGVFTSGYLYASRETTVQAEANAVAATFAAGKISCKIEYVIVKF